MDYKRSESNNNLSKYPNSNLNNNIRDPFAMNKSNNNNKKFKNIK